MLSGFSGSLVSEYYAETFLPQAFRGELGEDTRGSARRRLLRWARGPARELGPVSGARSVYDLAAVPLVRALGFDSPVLVAQSDGRFILSQLGTSTRSCGDNRDSASMARCARSAPDPEVTGPSAHVCIESPGRVEVAPALLVTPWGQPLDPAWRAAMRQVVATRASWCLMTNGCQLRLVDVRRAYARCFVEFDLHRAIDDEASFAVLWGLFRRDGFEPSPLIDRVSEASTRHAVGVCRSLRLGVLQAIGELLTGLLGSAPAGRGVAAGIEDIHEQSLTVVYRILFLLFAESRSLVPLWHPVYRESYSIEALRDLAERPGRPRGLWEALQAISRLAHAGCRAGTLRVTPFNGRLFAPSVTPLADSRRLDDETARRVLLALSTAPAGARKARARIAYRDLGVEQLGAVYESVLDYRPQVVPSGSGPCRQPLPGGAGATRARGAPVDVHLVPGSGVRKATGTFYTPRSITTYLVRRTLAPLVEGASPEDILFLRVVDPAMGSGAFLVAACRYLSGAYESALIARGGCHPSDFSDADRRGFRRIVAQRCLFGVDRNPMAVQLARLSLWLCTLAPERPLTFLDHHLLVGDSLVGASLDDIRRPPPGALAGHRRRHPDARLPLFDVEEAAPIIRAVLPVRDLVASTPDDTLAIVREKERLLAGIASPSSPISAWKAAADLWCGFAYRSGSRDSNAGLFRSLADALLSGRSSLPEETVFRWLEEARAIAAPRKFFHWALEFPEVFHGADGTPHPRAGFDAIVGNPPWDMIRGDNGDGASREAGRADAEGLLRFARSSGVYRAQGDGHGNLFQLFVERACHLARPGGRIGLVVPWGLAADRGCASLRRLLFDQCRVDSWIGFENSSAIFPIHRSVRFLLLTASTGGRTEEIACRLGLRDPGVLDTEVDSDTDARAARGVVVTRRMLERLSPDDLSVPEVKSAMDLALVEKITASLPSLSSPDGWGARFGRELNATDDRRHFVDGPDGLPVLEGKHLEPFRVRAQAGARRLPTEAANRLLDRARSWGHARLAYRDVAGPANRLTLIAAVVPANCVTVHTLFCLKTPLPGASQRFLCGILNSLVANYLVRLRVTTHVTTAIIERLPVPRPDARSPCLQRISDLVARLERSPRPLQDAAYPQLQALAARLYGLTLDELRHVLGTFPLIDAQTKTATLTIFESGDLAI